ncbi:MAG: aspartate/glutamate racemase family protein [Crocinitomicaceae bacterium]
MLGLLGLGSYTTTFYIKELNRLFQTKNKGFSTLPFKMLNTDFNKINPFLPDNFDKLTPVIAHYIMQLNSLDVDQIIVPNITLHQTIDQANLPIDVINKLIHPADISVAELKRFGVRKAVVFGSKYTMNSEYVSNKFKIAGIDIIKPRLQDAEKIDLIRKRVYDDGKTNLLLNQIQQIADGYSDTPILLACTELSLLKSAIPQSFDMVQLQIQTAIKYYSV